MFVGVERTVWVATAGFSAVWLIISAVIDGTTFHLAPAIVVAVAPAVATGDRLRATMVGLFIAVLAAVILWLSGRLDGPSLLPWGDAGLETTVAMAFGAVAGLAVGGRFAAYEG
jgi:hypothetical protein